MSEFYKETQSIFGETKRTLSVTRHNVEDLLKDLNDDKKAEVEAKYSPRSGANNYGADKLGNIVKTKDSRSNNHVRYLQTTFDKPFQSYTTGEIEHIAKNAQRPEDVPLVVPYFRGKAVEDEFQYADLWGLNSQIVEPLKNKVEFTMLVQNAGIEGFEVPESEIAGKHDFAEKAFGLLQKRKALYDKYRHELPEEYPVGLVVRLEESDGGYGSVYLNQDKKGIYVTPDGDYDPEEEPTVGLKATSPHAWKSAWNEAIKRGQDKIYGENGQANSDQARVVITPYLDIEDSPGMSMFFVDGHCYSLGWNGQLQLNGSKAAVGTSSYVPKNDYMRDMQQKYEDLSSELAVRYMQHVAKEKGIPVESLRGFASLDFMVPGKIDTKLRELQGKKVSLYLAESNPRWTNYTDAVMAMIGAAGKEPTIKNMKDIIEQGIYAEDSVDLHGADYELVRDIIQSNDSREKENRVFVRLPHDPMGAIYSGNWREARGELKQAIGETRKLQPATTEAVIFVNKTRQK